MAFVMNMNVGAHRDHPVNRDPQMTVGRFGVLIEAEPGVPRHPRQRQIPNTSCGVEVTTIDPVSELERGLAHMNRVEMMADLATSLAHEITEPMAAVELGAESCLRWMERDPPALEEVREVLLRIIKDARRAADIVERNRSLHSERRHI